MSGWQNRCPHGTVGWCLYCSVNGRLNLLAKIAADQDAKR